MAMQPALAGSDRLAPGGGVDLGKKGQRAAAGATLAKLAISLAILLVGGEVLCRVYWGTQKGTPFWARDGSWHNYYPQLHTSGVLDQPISNTDEPYDVLILGGSTISDDFGTIGPRLGAALQERLKRPVRVFNLAYAAHTSRDSVVKYRHLAHQRFDLVVPYDGINDARMNNTPPGRFLPDYDHCRWYATLNFLERHPAVAQSSLAFTSKFALDRVAEETGLVWYVPRHSPPRELMEYAKDVRTREPFRQNYEEIVTTARAKGERVVLMTFAYHIPGNYSLEACQAGQLDYGQKEPGEVEIWGKPAYIAAAIDQHNEAIRDLAARHREVVFIDQQGRLPHDGGTFVDCCHLSDAGCARFVENVLAALDVTN